MFFSFEKPAPIRCGVAGNPWRFSISLQMFALSGFAGTWMQFLDASQEANIIPPWRPGWSIGRLGPALGHLGQNGDVDDRGHDDFDYG